MTSIVTPGREPPKVLTDEEIQFIEVVKVPEWERYGWVQACEAIRNLIKTLRKSKEREVNST